MVHFLNRLALYVVTSQLGHFPRLIGHEIVGRRYTHRVIVMQIIDLDSTDKAAIQQVAAMLVEGFHEHWPDAWPDMESALQEVRESFAPDRISRVAIDEHG